MMGRQAEPGSLFYDFSFEQHVPSDHLLRRIDAAFNLGFVSASLKEHCSHTGRPSIDPELMIRMLLIGYLMGIRSERRLCAEVHLNLACRSYCKLGLEGRVPDASSFSKNRHGRFRESGIFRKIFEEAVRRCMDARLVRGDSMSEPGDCRCQSRATRTGRCATGAVARPGECVPARAGISADARPRSRSGPRRI